MADDFTGSMVFTVTITADELDVPLVRENLETLLARRLEQWSSVENYEFSTELYTS